MRRGKHPLTPRGLGEWGRWKDTAVRGAPPCAERPAGASFSLPRLIAPHLLIGKQSAWEVHPPTGTCMGFSRDSSVLDPFHYHGAGWGMRLGRLGPPAERCRNGEGVGQPPVSTESLGGRWRQSKSDGQVGPLERAASGQLTFAE